MSDNMVVECPSCSHKYRVSISAAGRRARCAKCNTSFVIPPPTSCDEDTILSWIAEAADASSAPKPVTAQPAQPAKKAPLPITPNEDGPRVQLLRIDSDGAHFEFPVASLSIEALRLSLPHHCVGCQARQPLNVHLLCWPDRMTGSSRWDELQNTPLADWQELKRSANPQWLDELVPAWQSPPPFDLPFPFLVCPNCTAAAELQTAVTARDTIEWCIVTVRNLTTALEFYQNNGGRHNLEYYRLLEARDGVRA